MGFTFRQITKNGLWWCNIMLAILLLCTKAIPLISPAQFWPMGLLGLSTPFIAGANVFFIILWVLFGKWRRVLLSVVSIVICWNIFSVGLAANVGAKKSVSFIGKKIKVMSYNVRLLNYYNWSGDKQTRQQILQFLKEKNADILCLQEFFSSGDSSAFQNVKDIAKMCGYSTYAANKNFETKRGFFGDIIFTKYNMLQQVSVQLDTGMHAHNFQYVDIVCNTKDTLRVYNLHMQSVQFSKEDMAVLQNPQAPIVENKKAKKDQQAKTQLGQGKIIVKKLRRSYARRGMQADAVQANMRTSPYPILLCGDLNDIPSSYTYFTLRGKLQDAFLDAGNGLGRTYIGLSPVLRIDNIFYDSKALSIQQFDKDKVYYSDHFPIEAEFVFLERNNEKK
jgi:endonuclease/exonuclease/phosphatase family metal-dependent hydrolase